MKKLILLSCLCILQGGVLLAQERNLSGTVLSQDDRQSLPGATVLNKETGAGVATDIDGNFVMQVVQGNTLVVSYVGFQTVEIQVGNQTHLEVSLEREELGEVVVVGSRVAARTNTDSPLPVDVFTADDITSTGQATFDKALQYRVPSFNTVQTPVNDATSLLDPYEIRNMGPSRTLILINGKRKNLSALLYTQTSPGRGETGADISAIPNDAIKRVEILRDGASAQYGSDAIAGVMNIILKDNVNYGTATLRSGLAIGGPNGADGLMLGLSINNGNSFAQGKGFINYTLDFSRVGLANRPGTVSAEGEVSNWRPSFNDKKYKPFDGQARLDALEADKAQILSSVQEFLGRRPDAGNINGSPETMAAKFLVNGGFDVHENMEVYFNAAYVYKKVNSFANYRTPQWRTVKEFPYLANTGFFRKEGVPGNYDGYLPTFEGDLNDYNGTLGFKAEKNGWIYDVSFTVGGNAQEYTVRNTHNRSNTLGSPSFVDTNGNSVRNPNLTPEAFTDTNGDGKYDIGEDFEDKNNNGSFDIGEKYTDTNENGQYDTHENYTDTNGNKEYDTHDENLNQGALLYRKNSPTTFSPGGTRFSHVVGNIDISKALSDRVAIGFGSEFRSETFEVIAGGLASYDGVGADSFAGNRPENSGRFNRYNLGAYFDIVWDITPSLLVGGTARVENYSDFGLAFVWRINSRWKFLNDKVTLRASYSTGFRAPTLHQIYTQKSQYSFVAGKGIQLKGLFNNVSPQTKAMQVPKLKSEQSVNFTAGLGWKPNRHFTITVDYYNIAVNDRIILSADISLTTAGNTPLDEVLKANNLKSLNFFVNGIDTRTTGIDLVTGYKNLKVGRGFFDFTLSGNYTLVNGQEGDTKNPTLITEAGQSVTSDKFNAMMFTSRPKTKWILGVGYDIDKFSFAVNNTLFGPTTFEQSGLNPNLRTTFDTKVVTDLSVSYSPVKQFTMTFNANNVFNILPTWKFVAKNDAGQALIDDQTITSTGLTPIQNQTNAITFNGRYSQMTYDGFHFSQLGTLLNLSLTYKFL